MKLSPRATLAMSFIVKWFKRFLLTLGLISCISIVFSFTDCPFWMYYWLGTHNADIEIDTDVVVLLGGGGMPSPDGLLRCYFAAEIAHQYPEASVVIAIPGDTALQEDSPDLQVFNELKLRGVDSMRIFFENQGVNTRSQALNIKNLFGDSLVNVQGFRLVTTPEHMFRSVATFRKLGFTHVGGQPAFGKDIDEELLLKRKKSSDSEGTSIRALSIRYNMWNYLKYEITVMREICAIGYYKLRGWI